MFILTFIVYACKSKVKRSKCFFTEDNVKKKKYYTLIYFQLLFIKLIIFNKL